MSAKVQRVQKFIQATNAVQRFDDQRTMMEALLDRELARKQVLALPPCLCLNCFQVCSCQEPCPFAVQVPQVTSMLRQATAKSYGSCYGRSADVKYVPAIDVAELRKQLGDIKATAQTLDVRI